MDAARGTAERPFQLSVIVPFHRGLDSLRRCLEAVRRAGSMLPPGMVLAETIVAADGADDNPLEVAWAHGARVVPILGPQGPALARTYAARAASGDLLFFIDSDVVVRDDALGRLASLFADPSVGAAFGAYDEEPADKGFFSQCRNLAHSFIHQQSNREATTFWAGLGAVRRDVFAAVGGFDPRFVQPSVEDIDLGYRIRAAGFRIVLEPAAQGTHLKRWTFWSSIVTDIRDRGVPWTQLLNRYKAMRNDLNLTHRHRLAVVMSYVLALCFAGAVWRPRLLMLAALLAVALWLIDFSYYRFFVARRGLGFAVAWFPFHIVHHLCNGVSFTLGTCLYIGRRWGGISLPGALPLTPWSSREAQ
jgi:cellulose synthase/poly-beta-1,6-N-acetylglucosamine synthase-like glycosyltransferase